MNFFESDEYIKIINDKEERIFSKCDFSNPTKVIQIDDDYIVKYYYFEDGEDKEHIYACDKRGSVSRLYEKDNLIFEWKNIDDGLLAKIINHSNGNKYFLFKEDLYGYSVLDLKTKKSIHYIPSESHEKEEEKFVDTFIWYDVNYNSKNDYLAIDGCVWAYPDSIIVLNFSNPMEIVDIKHWKNVIDGDKSIHFEKWNGNNLIYYIEETKEEKEINIEDMN